MRLKSISLLAAAATLVLATSTFAGQAQPAAPAPAAPSKFIPPIRGEAEVGMTKPVTKRLKDEVVTTFQVKNMSATNSIAGLKISEFWYDAGGKTVSGDEFRYRKPLQPNEIISVELRSPSKPGMANSQYKFEQANGAVKPKVMPKL